MKPPKGDTSTSKKETFNSHQRKGKKLGFIEKMRLVKKMKF